MNHLKNKYILSVFFAFGLFLSSCDDYLDINDDPNQSNTSDINLQMSAAQLQIAIGFGQRLFPIMGTWCQYHTGGPGVSLGEADQHQLSPSEGNEIFRTVYRASTNLNFIIKNAPTSKNYVAIAKLMKAYGIQTCVDLFGNLPYTEALKGDIEDGSVLHPKYDNAKDVIYPALIAEVKDALTLISEGAGLPVPAENDLVFGGHMDQWENFGNTLLLKLYLRSGKTTEAKDLLTSAGTHFITTNANIASVKFPGGTTASNPFWQAARSTALGNFYVATTTSIDYLAATNDPRVDLLYDKNNSGAHAGLKPGDVENAPTNSGPYSKPAGALSSTGGKLFSPTNPVIFISSWEGNLLIAEAEAISGGDGKAAYDAGVKAHFAYMGAATGADATYLGAAGAYNAANAIKSIALQKWVCMNGLQPIESWIETRRHDHSGNPIFQTRGGGIFVEPTKNALGAGIFPSILSYPDIEESLNQSFPGQHPVTDKVFWDK